MNKIVGIIGLSLFSLLIGHDFKAVYVNPQFLIQRITSSKLDEKDLSGAYTMLLLLHKDEKVEQEDLALLKVHQAELPLDYRQEHGMLRKLFGDEK